MVDLKQTRNYYITACYPIISFATYARLFLCVIKEKRFLACKKEIIFSSR